MKQHPGMRVALLATDIPTLVPSGMGVVPSELFKLVMVTAEVCVPPSENTLAGFTLTVALPGATRRIDPEATLTLLISPPALLASATCTFAVCEPVATRTPCDEYWKTT